MQCLKNSEKSSQIKSEDPSEMNRWRRPRTQLSSTFNIKWILSVGECDLPLVYHGSTAWRAGHSHDLPLTPFCFAVSAVPILHLACKQKIQGNCNPSSEKNQKYKMKKEGGQKELASSILKQTWGRDENKSPTMRNKLKQWKDASERYDSVGKNYIDYCAGKSYNGY